MAGEIKTGVVITADAKGFDEALQKILKVNENSLKGMKEQAKSYQEAQTKVQGLESQISKLAKTQATLFETMSGMKDKSSNVYKAMAVSLKMVQEESFGLEGAVKNLEKAYQSEAKAAQDLNRANEQLLKTDEKRKQAADDAAKRTDDQHKADARHAKWAFTQGFAQTAMPGIAPLFLQRGPGMWRQGLGQMAGGAVSGLWRRGAGIAGAAAQAPFSGAQGLAQLASSISPMLGGMMSTAMGYAGKSLEYQRAQVTAAPYTGAFASRRYLASTTARAEQVRQQETLSGQKLADTWFSPEALAEKMPRFRKQFLAKNPSAALAAWYRSPQGAGMGLQDEDMPLAMRRANKRQREFWKNAVGEPEWAREQVRQEGDWEGNRKKLRESTAQDAEAKKARAIAAARARIASPVAEITEWGVQGGINQQAALQQAMQVVQAGGGTFPEMQRQGMIRTSFAAQTMYGVSAETSGAFLQAGRRGGMVGMGGQADQALARTIGDALELGLSGSELSDYMQSMAEGIKQWETTGIPVAPEAIKGMAESFSKAGIAGTRAVQMARGVGQYVQGMASRGGPATGMDYMTLQAFGFTGKGGSAEYEQTILKMESAGQQMREQGVGGAMGGPMGEVMKRIRGMTGGDRAAGRLMLRNLMKQQMGIDMSQQEMMMLDKQLSGQALTPEEQVMVDREKSRRELGAAEAKDIATPGGLADAASTVVPESIKKQARIENKQTEAGAKMVGIVNAMDSAAANLTKAFSNLAGDNGMVKLLTGKFEELSKVVEKLSSKEGLGFWDYYKALTAETPSTGMGN